MTHPEGINDLSEVVPGVSPWPRVEFRGQVRPEPAERRLMFEREFAYVFGHSRSDVELVLIVSDYRGYSPGSDKAVFGVELRLRGDLGYETHIVKLGSDAEVGRDADNWDACTRGREVASRIFACVRKVHFPGSNRVAVIYRDAYTLFGPGYGEDVAPRSLETVAENAVFTNTVDPESVERAIAHIYTDLQLWFFPGAAPNSKTATAFYREELVSEKMIDNKKEIKDALALWGSDSKRFELRRDALWLFCGRDRPDADPVTKPARYLDPVELVSWALRTGQVPETLIGRGHGDLHGRNVLLGIRRLAAEYPAVFDYGGMSAANVLAWDFAKLETELKVRLLQRLYRDDAAHQAVREHSSWTWKKDTQRHDATTHRAERLRFFYVFEAMLAERTEWITGREIAQAWGPPGGRRPTGVEPLDRLLALLLRIRQEAALALGFAAGRVEDFCDELYFALAVYGLVHARWTTYTEPQGESALVSAGVAAAQARFARRAIADQSRPAETLPRPPYPSYRVPLAQARRLWKKGAKVEGKQLLDGLLDSYAHAVPLLAEHALFRCDAGEFGQVEKALDLLRDKAKAFEDEETLTRLGRALKEMADESWERAALRYEQMKGQPSMQFYRKALAAYEAAYAIGQNYFPGVNVAGLALLVGERERAREVAEKLRDDCAAMEIPREEMYWVFVTEGDAALILENKAEALRFYGEAIHSLQKGEEDQYAISSYRQLLRLRGPLGADVVNPVLQLFEDDEVLGPVIRDKVTRRIPG